MRSPEQQFALAKGLPISELAKVLQGQSDIVDMSIAQMVLREKTRAQKMMQGAAAQQQAQAPSVAEKDLMEAGIGSMPVDVDVPEMAGGGIVAFSSGSNDEPVRDYGLYSYEDWWNAPTYGSSESEIAEAQRKSLARDRLRRNEVTEFRPAPGGVAPGIYDRRFDSPALRAKKALAPDVAAREDVFRQVLEGRRAIPTIDETKARMSPAVAADMEKYYGRAPAPQTAPVAPPVKPPVVSPEGQGVGSLIKGPRSFENAYDEASRIAEKIAPLTKAEVPSAAMAVQSEKDFLKAAGFDTDLYKNQIEEIRKDAEKDKGRKSEAMNLRLLEAGLGILGGESPYAFVNIGKGSLPAVKGLAEDIKDLRKLEKDRQKSMRDLAVAQNQVAAGIGAKASERVENAQKRLDRQNEQQAALKADIAKSLFSADTSRYVADRAAETQRMVLDKEPSDVRTARAALQDAGLAEMLQKLRASPTTLDPIVAQYLKMSPADLAKLSPADRAMLEARLQQALLPRVTGTPDASKIRN